MTTTTQHRRPAPAHSSPRSFMITISAQFRLQCLGFFRNSRSLFFTVAFPIALALLFGIANEHESMPFQGTSTTVEYASWIALGLSAYVLLMGGFVKVAGDIASQRESGLLKRIRLRGSSDAAVLAGYVLAGLLVSIVCLVLLLAASVLFLKLPAPVHPGGVILVGLGGAILCTTIGLAYSAFIPSAEASQMLLLVPTLILMFLSGVFEPDWLVPDTLRDIGSFFPVQYLADAARSQWLGVDLIHSTINGDSVTVGSAQGLSILVGHGLWVCLAWFVVSLVAAARFFRWDARVSR